MSEPNRPEGITLLDTDPVVRTDARPPVPSPAPPRWTPVRVAVAAGLAALVAVPALLTLDDGSAPVVPGTTTTQGERTTVPAELTWAPPQLTDPETVEVSEDDHSLELEPEQDYVVTMPDEPLDVESGLRINGGRNVVLIGGEIRISEPGDEARLVRGLFLKDQTGTVHVEGLRISGPALGEGINLDQRLGATVQLQNVRVETVHGEEDGQHADVLQTWAGPSVLRVDRLTGYTTYQGFFLLPLQMGDQDAPELFDLRNTNLVGDDAAYMLWRDRETWPVALDNVWVSQDGAAEVDEDDVDRESFLYARGDDSADTWDDVRLGIPPGGDFVPEGSVGVGYTSPGYLEPTGD